MHASRLGGAAALGAAALLPLPVAAQQIVPELSVVRAEAQRPFLRAIAGRPQLQIDIESPAPGEVLRDPGGMAFLSGRALARYDRLDDSFDIVFAIDQSDSTGQPSGGDVNGDGVIDGRLCLGAPPGFSVFALLVGVCRPGPDSVFAAEIAAVRALVRQLDPRRARVGVVTFGGDDEPDTPDAVVGARLTSSFASIERALDDIAAKGPRGKTNIEAGVETAASVLISAGLDALGQAPPRQRVILFLSDGVPTLPIDGMTRQNRRKAVEAALRAAQAQIRLDSFGIGREALSEPETLVEMARVTRGAFTPVARPRDLKPIFEQVNFGGVETVRVVNRTNDTESRYTRLDADGTFSSLLQAVPGDNRIEIYAKASDGSEITRELTLNFVPEVSTAELPERLASQRESLLATRLADLRERNREITTQRDDQVREALAERIRSARKRAQERARSIRIEQDTAQQQP